MVVLIEIVGNIVCANMNSNFGGQNLDDTNEFFDPNNIIQNTNSYRTLVCFFWIQYFLHFRRMDKIYKILPQHNDNKMEEIRIILYHHNKTLFQQQKENLLQKKLSWWVWKNENKVLIFIQVQNLIERCLRLYMSQNEAITALHVYQNIEPGFISLGLF